MKEHKHAEVIGIVCLMVSSALMFGTRDPAVAGVAEMAPMRWMVRPLLASSFQGSGIVNGTFTVTRQGAAYPQTWTRGTGIPWAGVTDGEMYGRQIQIGKRSMTVQTLGFNMALGEATWILTQDAAGKRIVTWTGPGPQREGDNIPMWYDPREGPEANLGFTTEEITGYTAESLGQTEPYMGTWWPGNEDWWEEALEKGDPYSLSPVDIRNHRAYHYSGAPVDGAVWPEQIFITRWTNSKTGITTTLKAYGYSYQDFDDFNILEYTFTNTGDTDGDGVQDVEQTLDPVYFAFVNAHSISSMGTWMLSYGWYDYNENGIDDWFKYSDVPGEEDPVLGGWKVSFQYDGDNPELPWDDTGDPYIDAEAAGDLLNGGKILQGEGMLQSSQYLGWAPLAYTNDAASSFAFNARDLTAGYVEPAGDQPHAARWWRVRSLGDMDVPSEAVFSEDKMYSMVSDEGIDANPTELGMFWHGQTYGPYRLEPGQSAKLVMCLVAGTGAQMEGEKDIVNWARKGDVSKLPLGKEALKQNLMAAHFAYKNEYDVPDAPPDVVMFVDSTPDAKTLISWADDAEDAINPDYGEADVLGYRVYMTKWFACGGYELIGEIPKGTTELETPLIKVTYDAAEGKYYCIDKLSAAGFDRHYSVRTYTEGHESKWPELPDHIAKNLSAGLESGWAAPLQRTHGAQTPWAAAAAETDRMEKKIRVVPNPFIVGSGVHSYPGSELIRFVNLPRKCKVYIFSVTGDLIDVIRHDEPGKLPDKPEAWKAENTFNQITWNLVSRVSSGIYFWVVESETPESEGEKQRGTFVIIR